jgi:hypothetical protein
MEVTGHGCYGKEEDDEEEGNTEKGNVHVGAQEASQKGCGRSEKNDGEGQEEKYGRDPQVEEAGRCSQEEGQSEEDEAESQEIGRLAGSKGCLGSPNISDDVHRSFTAVFVS